MMADHWEGIWFIFALIEQYYYYCKYINWTNVNVLTKDQQFIQIRSDLNVKIRFYENENSFRSKRKLN